MNLKQRAGVVENISRSLAYGGGALQDIPGMLKNLLASEAWTEFVTLRGEHVEWERFADFAVEPPLRGLGSDLALLRRIVSHDAEVLDLLDQALQQPVGVHRDPAPDNVRSTPPTDPQQYGNSETGALRRLRKDRPDLHADVLAGSLSAHAAMVTAGYRPRTLTVPLDPERLAAAVIRHLDPAALAQLAGLLADAVNRPSQAAEGLPTTPAQPQPGV